MGTLPITGGWMGAHAIDNRNRTPAMEINQNPLNGAATLTKHGEDGIRVHNPSAPARSTPLGLHRQPH